MYEAAITQSPTPGPAGSAMVLVNTVGAGSQTWGTVQGNSVSFLFVVIEDLSNSIDSFAVSATQGQATVVSRPTEITGDMAGLIVYTFIRGDYTIGQTVCNAVDHRFRFVRR